MTRPDDSIRFSLWMTENQADKLGRLADDLVVSKGLLVRLAIDALVGDAPRFTVQRRRNWLHRIMSDNEKENTMPTTTTPIGDRLDIYGKTPAREPGEPAGKNNLDIGTLASDIEARVLSRQNGYLADLPLPEDLTPEQYINLEKLLRRIDRRIPNHKWDLKWRLKDVAKVYRMRGIGEVKP